MVIHRQVTLYLLFRSNKQKCHQHGTGVNGWNEAPFNLVTKSSKLVAYQDLSAGPTANPATLHCCLPLGASLPTLFCHMDFPSRERKALGSDLD